MGKYMELACTFGIRFKIFLGILSSLARGPDPACTWQSEESKETWKTDQRNPGVPQQVGEAELLPISGSFQLIRILC